MCRLLAYTGSVNAAMRRLLFDQLMIRSVADYDQSYGAGVTDGINMFKSGHSYMTVGDQWLNELDPSRVWMGHVRKPSKGTAAASTVASHPFFFPNGLIAAHNGYISDTGESGQGEPNVDSFRALKQLATAVGDGEITKELLNAWIESFGPGSEWAFMIYHRDTLYIVRGVRPMYYASQAGGVIFSTSSDVLFGYRRWCENTFGQDLVVGKIKELGQHRVATVRLGERMLIGQLTTNLRVSPDPNAFYIKHTLNGEEERINF